MKNKKYLSFLLALALCLSLLPLGALADGEAASEEPVAEEEILMEEEPAPIEEAIEEPAEEPAEEPIEEPVEEPVEEPIEEPAEEPVEEPAEEPVEEPVEEPIEEPAEEPVEELVEEPIEEPVEEPIEEPVEEPIEEPVEEPALDGASGKCGDNLTWTLSGGVLTISGVGEMHNKSRELVYSSLTGMYSYKDVRAPWESYTDEIQSVIISSGVTTIGSQAFYGCKYLTSVTIPASVMKIEDRAFFWCSALASVTIPNSVTELGDYAFYGCRMLTSVTIPAGVTTIGSAPFDNCSGLTSITVASGNTAYASRDGVLFNKAMTELICCPQGKAGAYAVPAGVTSIGDSAFEDCSLLTSVTIPAGVTAIGEDTFYYCSSLTSVSIPASMTMIGDGAFYGCSMLSDVRYAGSESEWNAISIEPNNEPLLDATIHYAPLPAPVLTEAFNSATGVRVSWQALSGAVKYRLLRKNVTLGETQWKKVGETTALTLIDTTAKSSNRYTYTVEAVDSTGETGARDETGRTCTYIAKADITALKAVSGGVSITWTKPAGAKNFRVMRRNDGETKWTTIAVVEGTSYIDTSAPKGGKLWYTVRGVSMDNTVLINSYNGTGWSIFHVSPPVLTEAFNSATGVRVSWQAVTGAAKYRLLRKNVTKGETSWTAVGTTTELTLIDTSAVSSNRYTYTVECIDANGRTCSTTNPTGRTCTYIAMAKITEIKSVSNGMSLTWSKSAGAKNFRVFRKTDGGSWTPIKDLQGTSYVDTTAQKGVKYWYTVRAVTLDGSMYINSYNATGWSCTRQFGLIESREPITGPGKNSFPA